MKKITIVGGGGTAVALAAYLLLQKQDVKLFDMEAYGAALKEIQEDGEIKMIGHGPTGVIPAPPITFDPKEAFDDAEVIYICMVATRHRELCDYIAPYLKDGQTVAGFRLTTGPDGIHYRYVTEDAYSGDSMLMSLGKLCGVETPLIRSFVTIASALNHRDFYAEGNTLENLGLADLSVEELNAYLQTGKRP